MTSDTGAVARIVDSITTLKTEYEAERVKAEERYGRGSIAIEDCNIALQVVERCLKIAEDNR